jgi:hypothetical protein
MRPSRSRKGADDDRGARQREQLVLRADEDAHAVAAFGEAEQVDQRRVLLLEILEQQADALEVLARLDVLEQVGLAAARSNGGAVARRRTTSPIPSSTTWRAIRRAPLASACSRSSDRRRELDSVMPRMRALRIVAGLDQRRGRQARRQSRGRGSRPCRLADQHSEGAAGSRRTNSMCFRPQVRLVGEDDAGAARQARQQLARLGQRPARVDGAPAAARDLRLDAASARPGRGRRPPASRRRTSAGPARSAAARRWYAARRSGRASRDRP